MKKYFIEIALVLIVLLQACSLKKEAQLAKPTEKQMRFADWELGAFIHFGLNVFTGQEHGDGKESPSKFNPTELDAEQWVLTAKAMGAKYACLTVRHEGGFCLWPSKTTDYTIANSPYKDGKGDIAREFVDACRKHGMKIGFYHTSSHDAHQGLSWYKGAIGWGPQRDSLMQAGFQDKESQAKYVEVQMEQMRELLTNYGKIDFMWSDHWGASGCEYIWKPITDLVTELQPNMVFMGTDTWIPGNETGHVVYPMWNAVNTVDGTKYTRPAPTVADTKIENNYGLLETDALAGHPLGKYWRPRECTTNTAFHTGGWFWHPDSIRPTHARPLTDHLNLYYRSVGLGANAIINLPPDNRGLIPDDIVAAAETFGKEIKNRFSNPAASIHGVKPNNTVVLEWPEAKEINTIVTMENIANGQRVAKYTFDAFVDGDWIELKPVNALKARKPYNANPGFETIGHKKIDRIEPVVTNKIRFRCLEAVADDVEIRKLAVFNNPPIIRTFNAGYPYLSGVETSFEVAHGGIRRDVDYKGEKIELDGYSRFRGDKPDFRGLNWYPATDRYQNVEEEGQRAIVLPKAPNGEGVSKCELFRMTGCYFTDLYKAVEIADCDVSYINKCWFGQLTYGIHLKGNGQGMMVSDNLFADLETALKLGKPSFSSFRGNTFAYVSKCFEIDKISNSVISGNAVYNWKISTGAAAYGAFCYVGSSENLNVTGNSIGQYLDSRKKAITIDKEPNGQSFIQFDNSKQLLFSNNIVHTLLSQTVIRLHNCVDCVVSNNIISYSEGGNAVAETGECKRNVYQCPNTGDTDAFDEYRY